MALRPDNQPAKTGYVLHKEDIDAEVKHEGTLRYFVEHTELGVLDKDQMGVISLVDAVETIGLQLPATSVFFEGIRQLSSGFEGRGRVQVKEVITAGAFPMSLLFGEQKTGIIDTIKGLLGKGKPQERTQ